MGLEERGDPEICERCKCCQTVWYECRDCGGEGGQGSACIDDMCHGQDECIHGDLDLLACSTCDGRGGWWTCGGHCCEHGVHQQGAACKESCHTVRALTLDE